MSLPKQLFAAVLALFFSAAGPATPLKFRITLAADSAPEGAQGRLLVFMMPGTDKRDVLRADFIPGNVGVSATEIEYLSPGETCDFNPDEIAFPHPFSQYGQGSYKIMALLDRDHSYPYTNNIDEGDIYSSVLVRELNPADTEPVALTLSRVEPKHSRLADTENVKFAEFESPVLSAFWGRRVVMRAGVVLPPADKMPPEGFPTVYHVHGFGGDYAEAWYTGPAIVAAIRAGTRAAMAHVFLDGSFPTGHHEFADSVNNGPWGQALVTEFVPWLERKYRLQPDPASRFLTGHSSGGWSTLWLQITYPEFFGGTWSTAPDPVDLRSFTGVDVTPGAKDNVYRKPDGTPRYLVRQNGKDSVTLEDFVRQEDVLGPYGGQFSSFESVFGPRGEDGRPMKLFNRKTGRQDPLVQQHWHGYDIRANLAAKWPVLGAKLKGKIHVICGTQDTFHLEESVSLLCQFLKEQGSDAVCELVPGRDHSNLYDPSPAYPKGLEERIDREMRQSHQATHPQPR